MKHLVVRALGALRQLGGSRNRYVLLILAGLTWMLVQWASAHGRLSESGSVLYGLALSGLAVAFVFIVQRRGRFIRSLAVVSFIWLCFLLVGAARGGNYRVSAYKTSSGSLRVLVQRGWLHFGEWNVVRTHPAIPHTFTFLGFQFIRFNSARHGASDWLLTLPYWPFICLAAILPLISLGQYRQERRMRKRLIRGLCLKCGYDLRATSDRCPECGTPIDAFLDPAGQTGALNRH